MILPSLLFVALAVGGGEAAAAPSARSAATEDVGRRRLDDSSCLSTCYSQTCDYWSSLGTACAVLESTYSCDCAGCGCGAPTSLPTTAQPTTSVAPSLTLSPTSPIICSAEGTTTYEGHTVNCIVADGVLYDIIPIDNGITTCGANDDNSCPDGTDIWVPRSLEHATAVWNEYGDSYVHFVGIYRPSDGCGSCTSYAMNSDAMASYSAVGWTSVAEEAEPWFMRSTTYSEPNGDYTAHCWLDIWGWDDSVGFEFNDQNCDICSDSYLCSSNRADPAPTPAPTMTPAPSLTHSPTPLGCADGWTEIEGSCFRFYTGLTNAPAAEAVCASAGGHLATIASAVQNAYAFALTDGGMTLIGLSDSATENDWVWADGSAVTYTNWASGQPGSEGDEDYAYLYYGEEWHDCSTNCGSGSGYLCSLPFTSAPPSVSPAPSLTFSPTAEGICQTEGVTTYEGNTVNCIAADGRLYDIFPIENGITTCGANDANSCPDGTDIWVPRSYDHAKAVWDEYGGDGGGWWSYDDDSYINIVGIYRPASGGATYNGCCSDTWSQAMNSDDMASYTGIGWTSVADVPEPWFMRSTAYGEPNGDYTEYCWLDIYHWDDGHGWEFNDESCNACSDRYLCSSNEWNTQPPTVTPIPTVTPVPTESPCCPDEFNDCGTFCDYDGDCSGDNYCGDGSWDLCDDDYDDNCIICSFDKSWYHTHNCPPGYNDCGWGCDLDPDCSAYNEHTGADSEQYSGLAQVAYSCSELPDDNYYYYYGGDYYYYGNGECDDDYAWFWGVEIDDDLEGQWSCWDASNAILTYEDCQYAAQAWADECDEWPPSVSNENWDGPQGCHVQGGPHGSWQFNSNFGGAGSSDHTPVCREDAWAGCPTGQWWPNNRNTNGEYVIGYTHSPDTCIAMASLEGCDIANLHIDATEGGENSCWCQFGSNYNPDFDDDWMACFVHPAPTPAPTISSAPTLTLSPTKPRWWIESPGICSAEGTTTYEGHTVDCILVDGLLIDVIPISNGITTCGANDDNSCPDGTNIWVPRSYDHAKAVWDEYGSDNWWYYDDDSYIRFVGIYRPASGGATYGDCCEDTWSQAMNSDDMASYTGIGWTSVADVPEPWFMRSTAYSEPNGDYTESCWLDIYSWEDGVGWEFNDESCNACSDTYLCSSNGAGSAPTSAPTAPTGVPTFGTVTISASLTLDGLECSAYTSDEEAILVTALAATIDGVEEDDIGDSTCTDARRRLALGNATGRRRLDGSASVAFDITIEPSAVGDDGFSPDDAVAAIHSSLSTAADSGALTSNIQDAASSSGNSNLAAVSVAAVGVASSDGTDYVAPTAEPTTSDYVIIGTLAPTTNSDYVIIIAASVGGGVALICCALVLGMFICFKAKILCFEDKAPLTAPVVEMTDMTQIAMAHPIALSPQNSKMQQQWGSLRNLDLNNATVVEAVPQQQGAVAVPQQAKSPALIL